MAFNHHFAYLGIQLAYLLFLRLDDVSLSESAFESTLTVLESSLLDFVHHFVFGKFLVDFYNLLFSDGFVRNIRLRIIDQSVVVVRAQCLGSVFTVLLWIQVGRKGLNS